MRWAIFLFLKNFILSEIELSSKPSAYATGSVQSSRYEINSQLWSKCYQLQKLTSALQRKK